MSVKYRLMFLVIFMALILMLPCLKVSAKNTQYSSNLVILQAQNIIVEKETINIRLHVGFAEVEQNFIIKNTNEVQTANFGLPQILNNSGESKFNNLRITVNDTPIEYSSTKEAQGEDMFNWKKFDISLAPQESKTIKINYWQLNTIDLNGLRSFYYQLKSENSTRIDNLTLNIYLMDQITLDNFDKNQNPGLDIKLEPLGWKINDNLLSWNWQNIIPSFNIFANFYWPNGDLTKISDLAQNVGLYPVSSSSNNENSWQMSDSSYLTNWEADPSDKLNTITFNLASTHNINELRILPGNSKSKEDYLNSIRPKELLVTINGTEKENLTVNDSLEFQNLGLSKNYLAKTITIQVLSNYTSTNPEAKLQISEIELGNHTQIKKVLSNETKIKEKGPIRTFFGSIYSGIGSIIKRIL